MVYTKVVGLKPINNFVVEKFSVEVVLAPKFKIFKWPQMEKKKVYMKVVGRDQIYNFVVEKIFIWDRYC